MADLPWDALKEESLLNSFLKCRTKWFNRKVSKRIDNHNDRNYRIYVNRMTILFLYIIFLNHCSKASEK